MHATTISVDLAKTVFQVHEGDRFGRVQKRHRLSRSRFEQYLATAPEATIVMEACGSAHYWGRFAQSVGHAVSLLPAQHVTAYRQNNKTDAADADGLLRAQLHGSIRPVPVKSESLQAIQGLHRVRQLCIGQRRSLQNCVRGLLREFGLTMPLSTRSFRSEVHGLLDAAPALLRAPLVALVEQAQSLDERVKALDRTLKQLTREHRVVERLESIPGIGPVTSTALYASVVDVSRYRTARHFAASLGLAPRVVSSGHRRVLGPISKRGNPYLRMLLIHGGRSLLRAAQLKSAKRERLSELEAWGLSLLHRMPHNKAAVAVANKLARVSWSVWKHDRAFQSSPGVVVK